VPCLPLDIRSDPNLTMSWPAAHVIGHAVRQLWDRGKSRCEVAAMQRAAQESDVLWMHIGERQYIESQRTMAERV